MDLPAFFPLLTALWVVCTPKVSCALLQQAAETYSGYQGLLGLQADEFANLTAAEKEAEGRFAVWKTLLELQEKVIDWTTGPILSSQDNSVSPDLSLALYIASLKCRVFRANDTALAWPVYAAVLYFTGAGLGSRPCVVRCQEATCFVNGLCNSYTLSVIRCVR